MISNTARRLTLNQLAPGSSPGAPTSQSAVLAFSVEKGPPLAGFFVFVQTESRSPFAEVRHFRPLVSGRKIPVPGAVPIDCPWTSRDLSRTASQSERRSVTCAAAAAAAGGGAAGGGAGGAGADRAATASAIGYLHAAANFFLIEDMERGETDVGYFFLTKRDCLIRCEGRCLRHVRRRYGRRCRASQ